MTARRFQTGGGGEGGDIDLKRPASLRAEEEEEEEELKQQ